VKKAVSLIRYLSRETVVGATAYAGMSIDYQGTRRKLKHWRYTGDGYRSFSSG